MWSTFAHQSPTGSYSVGKFRCCHFAPQTGKKNNNPAHPDYTPSIFPQAVLKESTKSTKLDRFNRAQKRKGKFATQFRSFFV